MELVFREKYSTLTSGILDIISWRRDRSNLDYCDPPLDIYNHVCQLRFNEPFLTRLESVGLVYEKNVFLEWEMIYEPQAVVPKAFFMIWADPKLFSIYVLRYGRLDFTQIAEINVEYRKTL